MAAVRAVAAVKAVRAADVAAAGATVPVASVVAGAVALNENIIKKVVLVVVNFYYNGIILENNLDN